MDASQYLERGSFGLYVPHSAKGRQRLLHQLERERLIVQKKMCTAHVDERHRRSSGVTEVAMKRKSLLEASERAGRLLSDQKDQPHAVQSCGFAGAVAE